MAVPLSRVTRLSAANSPKWAASASYRSPGHDRSCDGTLTPGSRRPSAESTMRTLGSHAASVPWCRFGSITAPSRSKASECGCPLPKATGAVGTAGPSDPLPGRAGPGRHPARRRRAAVAVDHRRRTCRAPRLGPRSSGRSGPWHHPSLRRRDERGRAAGVGESSAGRELPAPTRPAGSLDQGRTASA